MFQPLYWAIVRSKLALEKTIECFLQPKVTHYNFNEVSLFCGTGLLAKL